MRRHFVPFQQVRMVADLAHDVDAVQRVSISCYDRLDLVRRQKGAVDAALFFRQ